MIYTEEGRKMFSLYDCKMLECLGKGIWGLLKLAGLIAKTVLYYIHQKRKKCFKKWKNHH